MSEFRIFTKMLFQLHFGNYRPKHLQILYVLNASHLCYTREILLATDFDLIWLLLELKM